ncbi:GTP-binding protein [Atopobacter sp. AH10]|uniref:putative glycoside hydrolase n=1 Tax=Atopobacter sp. AH10 TaxID=2315861 RepID=UPI000EF26586|nr:putative glycoside hydrolase [Atopobacter sp. AH10]RLK63742.1 GTP-binding protein [Atopobacter sp. AH10]
MKRLSSKIGFGLALFMLAFLSTNSMTLADHKSQEDKGYREENLLRTPKNLPQQFFYQTGINIPYPKSGVKGIYAPTRFYDRKTQKKLYKLLDTTPLNAIVLDVKDDTGFITMPLKGLSKKAKKNMEVHIKHPQKMMKEFEKHQIYPIARIVVFKDTLLARQRPDLSFIDQTGELWTSGNGDSFVSPFKKEIWDYNVNIAIAAAKLGFKEIQFDYVRFPEGFETFADSLQFKMGKYANYKDDIQARVQAVSDFVAYAHKKLQPYGVKVGVDIFGYAATIPEAPGIGQNFSKISSHVDVISSMIYPSHWGMSYFGIYQPDLHPYDVVASYMEIEKQVLSKLKDRPISRPWLQNFTASYLGPGNYLEYGPEEVSAQIQAVKESGVKEYLLWDVNNSYFKKTDY